MKIKYYLMIIGLCTLLLLAACGSPEEPEQTQPLITTGTTEITTDTETTIPPETEEPETSLSEIASDEPVFDTKGFIDTLNSALRSSDLFTYELMINGVEYVAKSLDTSVLEILFESVSGITLEPAEEEESYSSADHVLIGFGSRGQNSLYLYNVDSGVFRYTDPAGLVSYYAVTSGNCWDSFVRAFFSAEDANIAYIPGDTYLDAVTAFTGGVSFDKYLKLSDDNPQKIENFSLIEYSVLEVSEDQDAVVLEMEYMVKPCNAGAYTAGENSYPGEGRWSGWIGTRSRFVLQRAGGSAWMHTHTGEDLTLESIGIVSGPMSNTELLESILATSPEITVTIFEDGVAHVIAPLPAEDISEIVSEMARVTDIITVATERPEGANYISFEFENSPLRFTLHNGLSCVCEISNGERESSCYDLSGTPLADDWDNWDYTLRRVHTAEAHRDVVFTCDNSEELSTVFGDVFAARWQELAPSNYQRTEDYVVLECTLNELSADGEYARLFLSYNVKPAFMEHFIYAGAARKLHGEWEGWINFSGNFTVIKQESGEWLVTAMYEY